MLEQNHYHQQSKLSDQPASYYLQYNKKGIRIVNAYFTQGLAVRSEKCYNIFTVEAVFRHLHNDECARFETFECID